MNIITITEPLYEKLLKAKSSNKEEIMYGFGGYTSDGTNLEFHIKDGYRLGKYSYKLQTAWRIETKAKTVFKNIKESEHFGAYFQIHTHLCPAFFSKIDQEDDERNKIYLLHYNYYIRIVIGTDGIRAEFIGRDNREFSSIDCIKIIGSKGIYWIGTLNLKDHFSKKEPDSIIHNRTMLGGEEIRKFITIVRNLRIGIVSLSASASCVQGLMYLTPREFILIDGDRVETHNANRQIFFKDGDIGRYKTEIIERGIHEYNPDIHVTSINDFFPSERSNKALKRADVIITFPDNNKARYDLSVFCARHQKILLEAGSGIFLDKNEKIQRISSHIRLQLPPPLGFCLNCLGLENTQSEEDERNQDRIKGSYIIGYKPSLTPASIVSLNATTSWILLNVLQNFLCGFKIGSLHLTYNSILNEIKDVTTLFCRLDDCPVCGKAKTSFYALGDFIAKSQLILQPNKKED